MLQAKLKDIDFVDMFQMLNFWAGNFLDKKT